MKRRDFIKTTAPVALTPFFVNGMPFKALGASPLLSLLAQKSANNGRVIVLIQLNGGNDGLNTIIPLDQYSNLSNARANILIPENKVLKLNGITQTGFHPAMTGLKNMYNDGLVSVVHDVGYPNPNFSHFRATDIWLTGADSNQYLDTGWLGRHLDGEYPGFPDNYPNPDMPDPLALQIGSVVSPGFQGPQVNMGMALSDPDSFYQLITGTTDPAPNTPAGHELTYIRLVNQQTQKYSNAIKNAAGKANNKSTLYPSSGNSLADQLKIVARMIAGGLKTPVYMVNIGSFDTHSAQVNTTGGTETGFHADLLSKVSEAIFAFQDDLKLLGIDDKVAGMTFSEFGRRIKSNASLGTDHGAAAPLIVFGKGVNPGFVGNNPTIPTSVSVNDNVPMQNDFRAVYTSILADWFEASATEISNTMLSSYPVLPIFKKSATGVQDANVVANSFNLGQNYPNPATTNTLIEFFTEGGYTQLKLYDNMGREVGTVAEGTMEFGKQKITLDVADLAPGNYYYQLCNGSHQQTKNLVVYR
jgi:uncharacterized protein (DUF1501 family)